MMIGGGVGAGGRGRLLWAAAGWGKLPSSVKEQQAMMAIALMKFTPIVCTIVSSMKPGSKVKVISY